MGEPRIRYANVNGIKRLPFRGGRAICSCCGSTLMAKCGEIVVHHWAHQANKDCDTWSEGIGQWHISWQDLVNPEHIEVARGRHRADIVGDGGTVIELQHSPLPSEHIAAREKFYGDMVWLFDATERFEAVNQGERAFFSLGRTKHLELCKKPVFLDFGHYIIQVDKFSDSISNVSGFGRVRSRQWFVDMFLSEVLAFGANASAAPEPEVIYTPKFSDYLKTDMCWRRPSDGGMFTTPRGTPYIEICRYHWKTGESDKKWFDYDLVIDNHPELANGWAKDEIRQMKDLLHGPVVMIGGLLRMLPSQREFIPLTHSVRSTEFLLDLAKEHIQAGRLPILDENIRSALFNSARQHDEIHKPRLQPSALPAPSRPQPPTPRQPTLFDDLEE